VIKKYLINLNYFKKIKIKHANLWNAMLRFELKKLKMKNQLRYVGRIAYNFQKFYLSNKNLWYIQKKKYLIIKSKKLKNTINIINNKYCQIVSKLNDKIKKF